MSLNWTAGQMLALAPDERVARAGAALAQPRKWLRVERHGGGVWGLCQGSGASPYQTQVELNERAFHCSCPSHKFPCKHALALCLLTVSHPDAFKEHALPDWVDEWLTDRKRRAEREQQRRDALNAQLPDPKAQARRAAAREKKVAAGVAELERWLRDLVREGLAALPGRPSSFWELPAQRMVDAQAPGLARLVRELSGAVASGEGWQERVLERLGRLHLLIEAYRRIGSLPVDTQADVRALIGWTEDRTELLNQSGVRDRWLVLGQRVDEEERLRVQRTWLWAERQARGALVLHFAHNSQPLDTSLVPGTRIDAEVVYYPSAHPLRALVKAREGPPAGFTGGGYATIGEAIAAYAAALARNPWLEQFPLPLQTVIPLHADGHWHVRDAAGHVLPIGSRFEHPWELLALSAGCPIAVFGEWDGQHLRPLSAWTGGKFVAL